MQSHDHLGSVLGETTKWCEEGCWDTEEKWSYSGPNIGCLRPRLELWLLVYTSSLVRMVITDKLKPKNFALAETKVNCFIPNPKAITGKPRNQSLKWEVHGSETKGKVMDMDLTE